jgi:hypothetical protein
MNSSNRGKNVLPKWSVLLVLLAVTAVALAQKDKKSSPAPSKPTSAPHATTGGGAKPGGAAGSAKPGGAGGAANRGPSGANTNRGGQAGANKTGAAGATNRGPSGANTNRPGPAGGNKGGPANAGKGGPAGGGNKGGPANAGRGGPAGGIKGGPANAGRTNAGGHTAPGRNVSLKGGGKASIRPNGQVRSIDRGGMHIEHGVHGGRTVVSERNGARIVTTGRSGGYVQRSYVNRGGHSYYSRTYYSHGVYRTGVYRGYFYGGHNYYGYYPGFYYHPGFYGWAYNPWASPIVWGVGAWGWGGAPWFGFYGGWFTPYPVYASPAFWLTDYLIAANLQAAYAARQEENADAAAGPPPDNGGGGSSAVALTPEVKQAIADEVKAQLAAQQAQAGQAGGSAAPAPAPANASNEVPPALDPARRTFVVDSDLTVVANGQECGLTAGDVIMRLTDTPDADNMVNASVSASKKSDCAAGQTVAVKVDDLQEMQNHFAEQLNNGLGELAKKQGTGGIPKAPDTGTTASDVPPPAPDTTAGKTLQDQQQAADQTETQVKQETAGGGGL